MFQVKVTNLPKWISELHLKQHFESCGTVAYARIALADEAPRALGYGFVAFPEMSGAQKALHLDGTRLDGAVIQVSRVDSQPAPAVEMTAEAPLEVETA